MLEEKGVVVAIEDDLIWVQTEIKTTCGSCQAKDNCATSSIAQAFSNKPNLISVKSDLAVNVGDTVVIGIEDGFVVQSAFYVYIFPIVGFMLMAFIAEQLVGINGNTGELIRVLIAFFGGWLGYWLARRKLTLRSCQQNTGVRLLNVSIPVSIK